MNRSPLSFRQAFGFAWRTFKSDPGLFVKIVLTHFIAWAALEFIVYVSQSLGVVFNVAAHVIFLILFAGLQVGFMAICLRAHDGNASVFSDLFAHLAAVRNSWSPNCCIWAWSWSGWYCL